MADPRKRFVMANGLSHHVLEWNDDGADTFVLCHGFLDQAWSFREVAVRLAAAGFRVVAFDWRGHGQTDHLGPGGYYHFEDYVLDLAELMPQVAAGGVHLLGHSMGGAAVAMFASTRPRALRSLTLIEGLGPKHFEQEAPDKLAQWIASMARYRQKQAKPMHDLVAAVKRLRVQNPELPDDLAYSLAEHATKSAADGNGLVWRFDARHRTTSPKAFDAEVFKQFLRRIDVPTLILNGSRGYRTADHDERMAAIADVREIALDNVGHMVHWMQPDALADALLGFVGH